jgi:transposase
MTETKTPITIPDDLEACQALIERLARDHTGQEALIEQLTETVNEQSQKLEKLSQEKQELELALTELLQRAFQKRRERYLSDPSQLALDFGDTPAAADAAEGLAEAVEESAQRVEGYTRRRQGRKPRSEKLPEHLPRREVPVELPESVTHCPRHGQRVQIGEDIQETLVFQPPKLHVEVRRFPKFACPSEPECGVRSPERPVGLVEGNRYDTSVAAEVLTGKYGYHLPIYREQDYFAGSGWTPSRSTLLNLLVASARVLRPLIEFFRETVLGSEILGTDDTRVTLLLPKGIPKPADADPKSVRIHEVLTEAAREGKPSVSARMWAYRSVLVPLNVFDFTVSRHRDGPDLFLDGFRGKLMADCYSGYQGIELRSGGLIQRGACATHARRKVFEAREAYPLESSLLLAKFQQLYDLEDRAKELTAESRLHLRQEEAVPIWSSIDEWLQSEAAQRVLPKSDFGKALGYLRNQWDPLQLYLTDGRMPIDNNDVEQLMKQVALGRKNWLFLGSVAAGERAADFFTLTTSAVRNDLDVRAYIQDVLDQLLAGRADYHALRPDVWKQSHPEAIRHYRVDERRDRADRTRHRRARRRAAQ